MSALAPFHAAVFARLKNDAGLAAYQHASMASAGVTTYDHVPKTATEPYVAIESHTESRFGMFSGEGNDDTIQLGIWDGFQGAERVLEIMQLIALALEAPLAVAGFGTARARIEIATTAKDPSGKRHGIMRIRKLNLA